MCTEASGQVPEVELPRELRGGAEAVSNLYARGVLTELSKRLRVVRKCGAIESVDTLIFLVFFFFARPALGGLRGFSEMYPELGEALGRLGGRESLTTSSSVSRFLKATDSTSVSAVSRWLLLHGAGALPLLREPHVQHADATGSRWHLFDYDPSREGYRERAPVDDAERPPMGRRSAAIAAPGHTGRARGEVVMTQGFVQHAGSALWLGVSLAPGNGDRRKQFQYALDAVTETCDALSHPPARALLRCDGEFGGMPSVDAASAAGVAFLTRSAAYHFLDTPDIRRRCALAVWTRVPDSGSGPVRYAADLGEVLISAANHTVRDDGTSYEPKWVRLIASYYVADEGRSGKAGVGRRIGRHVYELFMSIGLDATAWPAHEVVGLYYGRIGQENRFAQADRELGLDARYSWSEGGLAFVLLCGLLTWNIRLTRGHELAPALPKRETQPAFLPPEVGPAPDDLIPPPSPQATEGEDLERSEEAALRVVLGDPTARAAFRSRHWQFDHQTATLTTRDGSPLVLCKVQRDHQRSVLRFRRPDNNRYLSVSVSLELGKMANERLPDRRPSRAAQPDPTMFGILRVLVPSMPTYQPEEPNYAPAAARRITDAYFMRTAVHVVLPPMDEPPPRHPTLKHRPRGQSLGRLTWAERLAKGAERGPHARLEVHPLPSPRTR